MEKILESCYALRMKQPDLSTSEIRKDYFLDQYAIIAPKRNLRPDSFAGKTLGHKLESPGTPNIEKDPAIWQIADQDGKWQVKVIANAFPALTPDNPKAYGKQEIIIETPDHNIEFSELPIDQLLRVFRAYQARLKVLSKLRGIRYVSIFKNDGPAAGASIAHAHSQVMALPLVPPELELEAAMAEAYFNRTGNCSHCDIIAWELDHKVRIIFEDKAICAIAPYASRYPFEVWLLPKNHLRSFDQLNSSELNSLATIMKNLTTKLDLIKISYNFFLQNALAKQDHHFVLKLQPRPNIWAGLELGTGVVINPVGPEYASLWYQGKIKEK
jgi:UDPglucose--hexose-1-phosphate uridylyltransferase